MSHNALTWLLPRGMWALGYAAVLVIAWYGSTLSGWGGRPLVGVDAVAAAHQFAGKGITEDCETKLLAWSEAAIRSKVAAEYPTARVFRRAATTARAAYATGQCPVSAFLVAGRVVADRVDDMRASSGLVRLELTRGVW